jgi:hypothetical protein
MPVYRGYASQYGHGLGNVLGGLVRSAMPFVVKIAKSAGTQLLETGLDYVSKRLHKRKASQSLPRKRKKTKRVKRTISHHRPVYKRNAPPGKPARKAKSKKGVRDIFSK